MLIDDDDADENPRRPRRWLRPPPKSSFSFYFLQHKTLANMLGGCFGVLLYKHISDNDDDVDDDDDENPRRRRRRRRPRPPPPRPQGDDGSPLASPTGGGAPLTPTKGGFRWRKAPPIKRQSPPPAGGRRMMGSNN